MKNLPTQHAEEIRALITELNEAIDDDDGPSDWLTEWEHDFVRDIHDRQPLTITINISNKVEEIYEKMQQDRT